eukprot:CAMPEP_0183294954 /NCGR_PEP_ID=MMETSP0160_2-20130417/3085_1 /TAXON_ID=2839 ORGANISM="Odontella Sinensis, Strain Grunow 1884" /NCGR_SAMPLE_ID=MMETSP0160_2 /ASSEMBLY_ACC=CAM_ASM_000250 /LENGTH=103 /DNA_ID=CAMNT_0025456347 /DNA_START=133 /DNA_END=444 /DNA_ORIENTATION=-
MTFLLRYQIFLAYGLTFVAFWRAALKEQESLTNALAPLGIEGTHISAVVKPMPIWAIVALGLYGIASVGYGVATFSDCPDAAEEIDRQVKEARVALEKKGVKL